MRGKFIYVPIEVATTPMNGEALVNRWWTVHPQHGLAFYWIANGYYRTEEPAPQCNQNRYVAEKLCRSIHQDGDHEVRFVPVVFARHALLAAMRDAA